MPNIINILDFELLPNKKISRKCKYLKSAVHYLKMKHQYTIEEDEDVISLAKILLTIHEIKTKDKANKKEQEC